MTKVEIIDIANHITTIILVVIFLIQTKKK
jgi:hypothetical protein